MKYKDLIQFDPIEEVIKFNQLQSLLETRKSGQLTRIKSALVIEELQAEG